MAHTLIYLLESSLVMSVLFAFYKYLYYKTAYFNFCRYFLLGSLLFSLLAPAISNLLFVPETRFYDLRSAIIDIRYGSYGASGIIRHESAPPEDALNLHELIIKITFAVWIIGSIVNLTKFSFKLLSLRRLMKKSDIKKDGKYSYIYTGKEKTGAFSFFNYIFFNDDFKQLSDTEQAQIIRHEKIHADEKHSLDNILAEIYGILFWFNPIIRHIKTAIKELHEFITDNILTGNKNKPDYARLLVKTALTEQISSIKSPFSEEIKTRVKLISFPESDKLRKNRVKASVPVMIIILIALIWSMSVINAAAGISFTNRPAMRAPLNPADYKIASPFFISKTYKQKTGRSLNISHPLISYAVRSNSKILAVSDGKIKSISKHNNLGVNELTLTLNTKNKTQIKYSKAFKFTVKEGDIVKKGQVIGYTGDRRLYPILELKIIKNKRAVNPIFCY